MWRFCSRANGLCPITSSRRCMMSGKSGLSSTLLLIYGCLVLNSLVPPHVRENFTYEWKHSKVDQESAPVYISHDFLGQTPISSSKMLIFSRWPLLLSKVLKYKISIWVLQNLSSKVMRKSNWLNIVLNVNFMTLNNLNLEFFFILLEFILNLRSTCLHPYEHTVDMIQQIYKKLN
jgi:hypothetical protein